MKQRIFVGMIYVFVVAVACNEITMQQSKENFSVSMALDNSLSKITADDLVLTNVKILIRDLKLKARLGEDTSNVRTGAFAARLSLDGSVNEIALSDLPAGIYESAKFEIHKLEETEDSPDPDFIEDSLRFSVIVEGTYFENAFIYKSKKSAHQHIKFDEPIELAEGDNLNVTLLVNPIDWFIKNGKLLDPTNEKNEREIDKLIMKSFKKAFKDNNRDGQPD